MKNLCLQRGFAALHTSRRRSRTLSTAASWARAPMARLPGLSAPKCLHFGAFTEAGF
jgi:hypothetical protein